MDKSGSVDALSDNLQVNQKVVTDQTGISIECRSRGLQAPATQAKPLKHRCFQGFDSRKQGRSTEWQTISK